MSDQGSGDEEAAARKRTLLALLFVLLLVAGGVLLTRSMRKQSDLQDCVMQGRTNCAPIDTSEGG